MPIYIYEHPETRERKNVLQKMDDVHKFFDGKGVEWPRVFEAPHATISAADSIDPFSSKAFIEKTRGMHITQGDMWDLSATLSEKRAKALEGHDPVKQKTVVEYETKTQTPHPHKGKKRKD